MVFFIAVSRHVRDTFRPGAALCAVLDRSGRIVGPAVSFFLFLLFNAFFFQRFCFLLGADDQHALLRFGQWSMDKGEEFSAEVLASHCCGTSVKHSRISPVLEWDAQMCSATAKAAWTGEEFFKHALEFAYNRNQWGQLNRVEFGLGA